MDMITKTRPARPKAATIPKAKPRMGERADGSFQVLVSMNEGELELLDAYVRIVALTGEVISRPEGMRRLLITGVSAISGRPIASPIMEVRVLGEAAKRSSVLASSSCDILARRQALAKTKTLTSSSKHG